MGGAAPGQEAERGGKGAELPPAERLILEGWERLCRAGERLSVEGRERLYGDLAWLWPYLSPPEDYVEEAELFARLIRESVEGDALTLLHLTSGGGHVDKTLKRHIAITGIDASPEMVGLARRLNPDVEYVIDDVRTVRLGRQFDAVFIDDGVIYMLTEDDLGSVFRTAHEHLRSGGVMIVYVEAEPGSFEQSRTEVRRRTSGDLDLVYVENDYDPDTTDTTFESTFVYLIRQRGALTIETDRHVCGIFPLDTWRRLLSGVGFRFREERFELSDTDAGSAEPLFVCKKR